jgi:DsbC/DsbD-like thiol-disulfide interchange protein
MKTAVTFRARGLAAAALACLIPFSSTGQPSPKDPVHAELVSEVRAIRPGEPFWIGVRLVMNDGWHVNWINPGDAGLAPRVAWTLPAGFTAGEIEWPLPHRYDVAGLSIFGYDGEALLMCRVSPPGELPAGRSITIGADVTWLACREACVPGEDVLSLELAVTAPDAAAEYDPVRRAAFDRTRAEVPAELPDWRFAGSAAGDTLMIEITQEGGDAVPLEGLAFFPFQQGLVENSAPQRLARYGAGYRLALRRDRMSLTVPKRLGGVLVSESGWGKGSPKAARIDIPLD